jgi:excisionase family DNA binding protein
MMAVQLLDLPGRVGEKDTTMTQAKVRSTKKDSAATSARAALAEAEVLTLVEAAAYLRVPEAAVVQLAARGELPGRRIADEWRFLKAALQDWLGTVPVPRKGLLSHIGALRDDPYLEEMLRETYQRRGRPETEGG